MGMYTKFEVNLKLKQNLPKEIIKAIELIKNKEYLRDDGTKWETGCLDSFPKEVINTSFIKHPLFEPDMRLTFINIESFENNILKVNGNLKNYTETIEKFLDWISKYINESDNTIVGNYKYEEDEYQSEIVFKDGKLNIKDYF